MIGCLRSERAARARARLATATAVARSLARRSVREFFADRCTQMAAAISFHVLFSLFPLSILLVAVFGLVLRDQALRDDVLDFLLRNLPLSNAGRADLERLLESVTRTLSALGLVSLLGLAWSASGMMAALRRALNDAWDLERGRPFLRGKFVDLLLILALGLLFLVSLSLTIAASFARELGGRLAETLGPLGSGAALAVVAFQLAVPFLLSLAIFAFVYRVVPAAQPRLRDVWPGALVAALGFELLKNGFAVYLAYFGNYNAVYGSLGAIVAFLFFIYLSANMLLFGAEVASEWPRLRAERGRDPDSSSS